MGARESFVATNRLRWMRGVTQRRCPISCILAAASLIALAPLALVSLLPGAAYAATTTCSVGSASSLATDFGSASCSVIDLTATINYDESTSTNTPLALTGSQTQTLNLNGQNLTITNVPDGDAGIGVPAGTTLIIEDSGSGGSPGGAAPSSSRASATPGRKSTPTPGRYPRRAG